MEMTKFFNRAMLLLAASLLGQTSAFAQMMDEIDVRREGENAVVRFHFVRPVQYQRTIAGSSKDLAQIFYSVVPASLSPESLVGDRRTSGGNGLPQMVVTDEAVTTTDLFKRKLLVQFDAPTQFSVRAGRKREYIEIVMEGLGAKVSAQVPVVPGEGNNFLVVLQTTNAPGEPPKGVIPVELEAKNVFTSRRVADGKTLYDLNLGHFVTKAEAEKAQQLLRRRFPSAIVAAVKASSGLGVAEQAPVEKNFQILLQSSTDASAQLSASIPAKFQSNEVFTAKRTQDGQVIYDFILGYFATQDEADAANRLLVSRFPNSAVIAVNKDIVAPQKPIVAVVAPLPESTVSATSAAAIEVDATRFLAEANAANDRGDYAVAITALDALLNLPPNASSRKAQEQIGITRLKLGDRLRARGEFETFLKIYPTGADSDQIRGYLQNLPSEAVEVAKVRRNAEAVSVVSGSISTFYYGGESKTRSQDFADSPLSGTPVLVSENELSNQDQSQLQTNIDLNWRYRDTERDQRFVLRQSYASNFLPNRPDRERLSALYYEQRNFDSGTNFKIGRQSPSGGGILYRFDGAQVGYRFAPKWKVGATYGVPTDALLDARRSFYGVSLDAEALTQRTSATVYFNQQLIDELTDRSAVGVEWRYFNEGLVLSSQLDYDQLLQGLNVASLQGSWQSQDNAVFNFLADRRAVPVRSLGNVLFFQDPTLMTPARSIRELLQTTPLQMLLDRVNGVTPFQSQASIGYNRPIGDNWQAGGNLNYTNVDEIKPVADILPNGQPSTGDLYGFGLQLVGSNLYSARDTHVFSFNYMSGPTYSGQMLAYNNMTGFVDWQLEPALRYYTQSTNDGTKTDRWTPSVRLSYRAIKRVSLESEISYEIAETTGPTRKESATRMFYYLGGRFDF
jgi:tetratricopeptide (TPR) repeat protein